MTMMKPETYFANANCFCAKCGERIPAGKRVRGVKVPAGKLGSGWTSDRPSIDFFCNNCPIKEAK